jgi:hypothetical protein
MNSVAIVVNPVTNLLVPWEVGNFSTTWVAGGLRNRIILFVDVVFTLNPHALLTCAMDHYTFLCGKEIENIYMSWTTQQWTDMQAETVLTSPHDCCSVYRCVRHLLSDCLTPWQTWQDKWDIYLSQRCQVSAVRDPSGPQRVSDTVLSCHFFLMKGRKCKNSNPSLHCELFSLSSDVCCLHEGERTVVFLFSNKFKFPSRPSLAYVIRIKC